MGEFLGLRRRETEKERERERRGIETDVPKLYTYNVYEHSVNPQICLCVGLNSKLQYE